jgi:predicted transcriptional regulator
MAGSTITVRTDPEVAAQIAFLAEAMDRSRNWVIEEALKQYIQAQSWQLEGIKQAQAAHSTPFGHLFHQHPAGDSTGIRPPVPRAFGRGSRSEATQAGHCYSAGVVGVNVRA